MVIAQKPKAFRIPDAHRATLTGMRPRKHRKSDFRSGIPTSDVRNPSVATWCSGMVIAWKPKTFRIPDALRATLTGMRPRRPQKSDFRSEIPTSDARPAPAGLRRLTPPPSSKSEPLCIRRDRNATLTRIAAPATTTLVSWQGHWLETYDSSHSRCSKCNTHKDAPVRLAQDIELSAFLEIET